jgi:hypothetical protein
MAVSVGYIEILVFALKSGISSFGRNITFSLVVGHF